VLWPCRSARVACFSPQCNRKDHRLTSKVQILKELAGETAVLRLRVDGISPIRRGAHSRLPNGCPCPRFFPHEGARSPKRVAGVERLALAGRFGTVHPETRVSADSCMCQFVLWFSNDAAGMADSCG